MAYDMITIGDIKLDTFVVLSEASVQCQLKMPECLLCLEYGKKIPVEVVDSQIAGSAPNVATGLSRMGFKTGVVSIMGIDGTRKHAYEVLKREKVDTRFIRTSPTAKSSYSVVLNFKGEKTILASHLEDVYHLPKFTKPKWLYMSELGKGYERLFHDVANYIKKTGVILGFNPGAVQIQEGKRQLYELIQHTHVLFVNLEEAQTITKEHTTEIHRLATSLYKMGPKLVVITNGKEGAHVFNGEDLYFCHIFPSKMVEATGAGDAFATGFMGALMNGQTHNEALRWGAVNAASVVAYVGPTKGLLSAGKIRARLRKAPKFKTKKV